MVQDEEIDRGLKKRSKLLQAIEALLLIGSITLVASGQGVCFSTSMVRLWGYYGAESSSSFSRTMNLYPIPGSDSDSGKKFSDMTPPRCISIGVPVTFWTSAHDDRILGQFFVLATASLTLLIVLMRRFESIGERSVLNVLSVGACLLNAGLEIWYCVDGVNYAFDNTILVDGLKTEIKDSFVQSWAAASALFFILAFILIWDMTVGCQMKERQAEAEARKIEANGTAETAA